jgi:hypothetical protein
MNLAHVFVPALRMPNVFASRSRLFLRAAYPASTVTTPLIP